jgi:hypothetical protein
MPRNPTKTAVVTVSLPIPLLRQVDRTRKADHRNRSALVREALRVYFARADSFPVVTATPGRNPRPETCPPQLPHRQHHHPRRV